MANTVTPNGMESFFFLIKNICRFQGGHSNLNRGDWTHLGQFRLSPDRPVINPSRPLPAGMLLQSQTFSTILSDPKILIALV